MSTFARSWLKKIRTVQPPASITVVSGLPRSGTSLMMKMLAAGGLPPMTDELRTADEDNPKGYYEFERVKKLKEGDFDWLDQASGRAVKIISALLEYLPPSYHYRVVFMRRDMNEILRSQKQMLVRRGEPTDKVSDEKLAALYQKHLDQIETWLSAQSNFQVTYVSYNHLLSEPEIQLERVKRFLNLDLQSDRMLAQIDPSLYRQRSASQAD